jgi:hypothetical protein
VKPQIELKNTLSEDFIFNNNQQIKLVVYVSFASALLTKITKLEWAQKRGRNFHGTVLRRAGERDNIV